MGRHQVTTTNITRVVVDVGRTDTTEQIAGEHRIRHATTVAKQDIGKACVVQHQTRNNNNKVQEEEVAEEDSVAEDVVVVVVAEEFQTSQTTPLQTMMPNTCSQSVKAVINSFQYSVENRNSNS